MITVVKVTSDRESERRNAAAFFVIRVKVATRVPIKHGQGSGRVKTEGSRAATADRSDRDTLTQNKAAGVARSSGDGCSSNSIMYNMRMQERMRGKSSAATAAVVVVSAASAVAIGLAAGSLHHTLHTASLLACFISLTD